MTSFGSWVVRMLAANGVDTVFGIPGVHTVELYRGLHGSGIRHVTPRHEQGAGFMADGYARVTGKPGVCFIITGPGLTNIATAMGQAFGDSIPMLVISTVNPIGAMGTGEGHLHELPDQRQLMAQVSAFSHTVLSIEEFPSVLARALAVFASARPRPVHIEIPIDLLERDAAPLGAPRKIALAARPAAAEAALAEAVRDCDTALRPLIIAGGGALDAAPAIRRLAEKLDAPVLMTTNARGVLPNDHPLGIPIWPGSAAGLAAMAESDLIIALGTELGPTDFGKPLTGEALPRMIRCDVDPAQMMRGRLPELPILADAADLAERLADRVAHKTSGTGEARAAAARRTVSDGLNDKQRAGIRLLEILRDSGPGAVIAGDSTQAVYAGSTAFAASAPRQYFSSATGYGTLGYGLPAAIGARIGKPRPAPVFALIGDGGLQFSLSELGTAVEAGEQVVMILWNNRGYGEIKSSMSRAGMTPLAVDIFTPDFKRLAQGYGWLHVTANDPATLASCVAEALQREGSTVIEVEEDAFVAACRQGDR